MVTSKAGTRLRVLCADDDETTVAAISTGLGRRGWNVSSAADSMQAMMFAVQDRPDIIVLDLSMPGGDGTHVLRRLKKSARTMAIPVVILSGSDDPRAPARAMRLGAEAFLPKPVDIDLLEGTLEAVLGLADPPADAFMAEDQAAGDPDPAEDPGDAASPAEDDADPSPDTSPAEEDAGPSGTTDPTN
ncbi:MAG: response regulator [Gemmatimonadales bacterium]|nr:MAG: response regulator [Gemmatimonadales bacterium]